MKYVLTSVHDAVSNMWYVPGYFRTEPEAIRSFALNVNEPSSLMGFKPDDFSLWLVGSFDTDTGALDYVVPAIKLADASGVVKE